jgi:hypothetical protein
VPGVSNVALPVTRSPSPRALARADVTCISHSEVQLAKAQTRSCFTRVVFRVTPWCVPTCSAARVRRQPALFSNSLDFTRSVLHRTAAARSAPRFHTARTTVALCLPYTPLNAHGPQRACPNEHTVRAHLS